MPETPLGVGRVTQARVVEAKKRRRMRRGIATDVRLDGKSVEC